MKKWLTGLLLIVISGCSADVQSLVNETKAAGVAQTEVDETRAAGVAQQALANWIEKQKDGGNQDINQIQGATFDSISVEGNLMHVVLVNDASEADANGYLVEGGMHIAHFNVYLDLDYQVVKVVRGPDIIE